MRKATAALTGLALALCSPALAGEAAAPVPAPAAGTAAPPHDWKPSMGGIPFFVGRLAGQKEAEFSGRPILLYFASRRSLGCERLAAESFGDPQVVRTARKFVPVLVDGDAEKEFARLSWVPSFPTILFLNPLWEEVDRFQGFATPATLSACMNAALLKMPGWLPTWAARDLDRADAALAAARERGEWREVCRRVLAIETIGHEGPAMERARAARAAAEAEAKKRLGDATDMVKAGKDDEAAGALRGIARDFEGFEAAAEAKSLLGLLESDPGGGDDGNGGKGKKSKSGPRPRTSGSGHGHHR